MMIRNAESDDFDAVKRITYNTITGIYPYYHA